ncbi:MAG: hypothetical protein ACE15E_18095 [Acidobacteriota bacterium]
MAVVIATRPPAPALCAPPLIASFKEWSATTASIPMVSPIWLAISRFHVKGVAGGNQESCYRPRRTVLDGPFRNVLGVSPDRRTIVFNRMKIQESDLMLVENFR